MAAVAGRRRPRRTGRRTWRAGGRQGRQGRGQALLLPAPEGLQVLRGQDRLHRLQGREAALRLRAGAGQGPSAAHVRHLRRAPAQADAGDQAGAEHRAPAFRRGLRRDRSGGGAGRLRAPAPWAMPESSVTARVRERPEPRTGGALGAALFSALMFGSFVRLPLLLPFALLAPFPLLVVRLRSGAVPGVLATLSAAALLGALLGGAPGLAYLMLVAPILLIGESMARGRGMVRGCGLGLRRAGPGDRHRAPLREPADGGDGPRPPRALAVPGVPGGHARERAAGAGGRLQRAGGDHLRGDADHLSGRLHHQRGPDRPRSTPRCCGSTCAGAIRAGSTPASSRACGGRSCSRWPSWRMGLAVLSPLLRPAAYNGLLILAFFFGLQGLAVVVVLRPAPGRAAAAARGGAGAGPHQSVGSADPGPHRPVRHLVRFPEMGGAAGDAKAGPGI